MSIFVHVNDEVLINRIKQANARVTFVGPGLSANVAKALKARKEALPSLKLNFVLDADPEVCRFGLGELEGLKIIKTFLESEGGLLNHEGIRLGILIADDRALIFAPTPLLLEAGTSDHKKPNGIEISSADLPGLEAATGATVTPLGREVGMDPISEAILKKVESQLKVNPPRKFDVARSVRVFSSMIQYVEFEFRNYQISKKSITIPPEVLAVFEDLDLQTRLKGTIKLLDDVELHVLSEDDRVEIVSEEKAAPHKARTLKELDSPSTGVVQATKAAKGASTEKGQGAQAPRYFSEDIFMQRKNAIVRKYLKVLPSFGWVIMRSEQIEFKTEVVNLEKDAVAFYDAVSSHLAEQRESLFERILKEVLPGLRKNPPSHLTRYCPKPSEEHLKDFVLALLNSEVKTSADKRPKARVVYKDVSYENHLDTDFKAAVSKAFPHVVNLLFDTYNVAPEIQPNLFKNSA